MVSHSKLLTCRSCCLEFRGERGLSKHKCKPIPEDNGVFTCSYCGQRFRKRASFLFHTTSGCAVGKSLSIENNPKMKYQERIDMTLPPDTNKKRPHLRPGAWEELWFANFCGGAEIGMSRAQELQDFIAETYGNPKMARYRTILSRLESGTYYPRSRMEQFQMKCVFPNVPPEHGGNDQGEVVFQYSDIVDALIQTLFDPAVCAGVDEPYVLHPKPLYDGKGVRYYVDLASGTWWEETALHMVPKGSCVFPIILYIDETHLTGSGRQKAKPIFAQAGILAPECRQRDASWVCVGLMPVLHTASANAENDSAFKSLKVIIIRIFIYFAPFS